MDPLIVKTSTGLMISIPDQSPFLLLIYVMSAEHLSGTMGFIYQRQKGCSLCQQPVCCKGISPREYLVVFHFTKNTQPSAIQIKYKQLLLIHDWMMEVIRALSHPPCAKYILYNICYFPFQVWQPSSHYNTILYDIKTYSIMVLENSSIYLNSFVPLFVSSLIINYVFSLH